MRKARAVRPLPLAEVRTARRRRALARRPHTGRRALVRRRSRRRPGCRRRTARRRCGYGRRRQRAGVQSFRQSSVWSRLAVVAQLDPLVEVAVAAVGELAGGEGSPSAVVGVGGRRRPRRSRHSVAAGGELANCCGSRRYRRCLAVVAPPLPTPTATPSPQRGLFGSWGDSHRRRHRCRRRTARPGFDLAVATARIDRRRPGRPRRARHRRRLVPIPRANPRGGYGKPLATARGAEERDTAHARRVSRAGDRSVAPCRY